MILFYDDSSGAGSTGRTDGSGGEFPRYNPSSNFKGCSFCGNEYGNGFGDGWNHDLEEEWYTFEHLVTNAALTLTWRDK